MKHHFGDLLDRTEDYWTIVPNGRRYRYSADAELADKDQVRILTVSRHDAYWRQVFDCPNLEELTLHEPSKEQIAAMQSAPPIKRLRVSFLRTPDIAFMAHFPQVEELVFEYVSGFSDLSPLRKLGRLKSLHLENLRRVSNFDGLNGIHTLRYLYITGTLDWKQPIDHFDFLASLPNLEVFNLGFVTSQAAFPAFRSVLAMTHLKKFIIVRNSFATKEYAFLMAALPGVKGCDWELCWPYNKNYEFLGKRAGSIKQTNPMAATRCAEFASAFAAMKQDAEALIRELKAKN